MKEILIAITVAFVLVSGASLYADACGSINKDIQEMQAAVAHIKEHGQITDEDAAEAARDIKQARKDLQAVLKSGEAPGEEEEMIKRAIAAMKETEKGLKKKDMERTVNGLEGIVAVMVEYRDHHKCGQ